MTLCSRNQGVRSTGACPGGRQGRAGEPESSHGRGGSRACAFCHPSSPPGIQGTHHWQGIAFFTYPALSGNLS